ncbi:TonB-dependent receptor plug domain-containing protein, partial [Thermodesulfatator atlanticus]
MSFGKLRSVLCLLIFFVLSGFAVVFAESGDDSSSVDLGDILVKGEAISTQSIPGTVNVIKEGDIEKQIIQRTDELLEQVPGIEIINYNQGGVANAIM